MNRRTFIATASSLAIAATPLSRSLANALPRTQWRVRGSEGLDAIVFLGPLSGEPLYQDYYAAESAEFGKRLPEAVKKDIASLWKEAGTTNFGLLGPSLALVASGADCETLDKFIAALSAPNAALKPSLQASPYWDDAGWAWFAGNLPRFLTIFSAMRDAGFSEFRRAHLPKDFAALLAQEQRALSSYDVISWQEKLTGRTFEPVIDVVVLAFVKPHGIKVQGQAFLHAIGYPTATTVQIAGHEMLHPPVAKTSDAWKMAMGVVSKDPLIEKIVAEHDPQWGYRSINGLLDEDICQALDQLICEALGVADKPAARWHDSDDGIHVMAAGIYGLLLEDRWAQKGGNFEKWLARAASTGRLSPGVLHPVAARVLERPIDRLWPLGNGAG